MYPLLDIPVTKTLLLIIRIGWESEMKKVLGDVRSGRSLSSPPYYQHLDNYTNRGWECGAVCVKGQPNPCERTFPSNWSCYGQTPGQPLITLNSNYIIRDRLLKLSEKQCHRNGNFSKVLIEALEQKNPEGTAIPPGHPHPWLWGAGAPGTDP